MSCLSVKEMEEYWGAIAALKDDERLGVVYPHQMPPWEELCEQLRWRCYRLDGGHFSEKRHGFYGVYRLFALAADDNVARPRVFNRLCGSDPTGTLYIGHASSLHARLNQLRRSFQANRNERSHAAPAALRALRGVNIPIESLRVDLLFTNRIYRAIERDLLDAYRNTYGDAPPLNYRV